MDFLLVQSLCAIILCVNHWQKILLVLVHHISEILELKWGRSLGKKVIGSYRYAMFPCLIYIFVVAWVFDVGSLCGLDEDELEFFTWLNSSQWILP